MTTSFGEGFVDVPLDRPEIEIFGPSNVQLVGGKWTGPWTALKQYYRGDFVEPPAGGVSFCLVEHVSTDSYDEAKFARLFDSSVISDLVLENISSRQVIAGVSGNITLSVGSMRPLSSTIYVLSLAANITNISSGAQDGQLVGITNATNSSANLTVKAAGRIGVAADIVLAPGNGVTLIYDEGSDVFRPYSIDQAGGNFQTQIDAINATIGKMLTGAAVSAITIASGVATPTKYIHRVEGEGTAPDTLDHIATTNVPDGYLLFLTWNGTNAITVQHGAGGAGQVLLKGSVNCALDADGKFLLLIRSGTSLVEIARLGFAPDTAPSNPMVADLDAGGYAFYNYKPKTTIVSGSTLTVDMSTQRGQKLKLTNASSCAVTLPNTGVAVDDFVIFDQQTPTMTFAPASGASIVHPLSHDKGLGKGSWVVATVASVSPAVWNLVGMTTAASTDPLARTAIWNILDTVTDAPANVADWGTGATTGFDVANGDTWLFFGFGNLNSNSYILTNKARMRLLLDSTVVMDGVRDRSPNNYNQRVMMWGQTFGADGAHTLSMQTQIGATSYTAKMQASAVAALKLTGNDFFVENAAEVTANSGSYVNSINSTHTYAADDYLILVSFLARTTESATPSLGKFALEVDAVTVYDEVAQTAPGNDYHACFYMYKAALTGSKNIKLKVASNDTQTVRIKNASIAVLSLAQFKSYLYDTDAAEETNTTGTLQGKGSASGTLTAGWSHLLLTSVRLQPPVIDNGLVKAEIQVNGSQLGGFTGVDTESNNSPTAYKAAPAAVMRVVSPLTATDTYTQMWATGSPTNAAKAKLSQVALLALKPLV